MIMKLLKSTQLGFVFVITLSNLPSYQILAKSEERQQS